MARGASNGVAGCAHTEFLAALLGALNGNIRPVDEVVTHLQRSFPELGSWSEPEIRNLLQGFMALLAFARRIRG